MNKTVFGITYLICVNTLSEFTMINGNTMNTEAHNNDLLLIIKHCQYFVHSSNTTCKKFNETFLNKPWGREKQIKPHILSGDRGFSSIINWLLWHPWKAPGAVRGLHRDVTVTKEVETVVCLKGMSYFWNYENTKTTCFKINNLWILNSRKQYRTTEKSSYTQNNVKMWTILTLK